MESKRNALAELAEELRVMSLDVVGDEETVLDKAYRIIDGLAKVEYVVDLDGNRIYLPANASMAISKCRAIAEEGVKV